MLNSFKLFQLERNSKKHLLQICWYAATLRNFINSDKVSKEEVTASDVAALCNEIKKGLLGERNAPRFTLYLSAQLMYGTLIIFNFQAMFLEDSCKTTLSSITVSFGPAKNKKKKPKEIFENNEWSILENISEIDIASIFPQQLPENTHLIKEVDSLLPTQMEFELSFGSVQSDVNFDQILTQLQQETLRIVKQMKREKSQEADLPFINNNLDQLATPIRVKHRLQKIRLTQESSTSESASTALSPLKKRSQLMDVELPVAHLSPRLAITSIPTLEDDDNMMMTISEPIEEAALPTDFLPTTPTKETFTPPALPLESFDESMSTDINLKQFEKPNTKDASWDLPIIEQTDVIEIQEVIGSKNIKKGPREKKVFWDEVKQIEIVEVPLDKYTTSKYKLKVTNFRRREDVKSLVTLPSTLKRKIFHRNGSLWSNSLMNLYSENVKRPFQPTPVESEEEVYHSPPKITKEVQIRLHRIETKKSDIENNPPEDNMPNFDIMNQMEPMEYHVQCDNDPSDSVAINYEQKQMLKKTPARLHKQKHYGNFNNNPEAVLPTLKKFKAARTEVESESLAGETQSETYLPISDFLAFVNVWWDKAERDGGNTNGEVTVDFEKIVNPDNHTDEAIRYLIYCFTLEQKGELYLEQEEPYGSLYLVKPN